MEKDGPVCSVVWRGRSGDRRTHLFPIKKQPAGKRSHAGYLRAESRRRDGVPAAEYTIIALFIVCGFRRPFPYRSACGPASPT